MKILIINNSQLTLSNHELLCEPRTGAFVKELKNLKTKSTMYGQFVANDNNNIHTFDIRGNGITVAGSRRINNKIINYLNLYIRSVPYIIDSDFVYIFYPSSFKYLAILCWILGTPFGLYVRGEKELRSRFSTWTFNKAKVIFTVSDYFTQLIINSSVNKNIFTAKPLIYYKEKDIDTHRVYHQPLHFKLLFLARIETDKGIIELLHALYRIRNCNHSFSLDLVGEGPATKEVKQLIKDLGLSNIVSMHGAVKDPNQIKKFYEKSDIFILPSYHEGFPRTLYEAMIFGTPIITTFVGGVSSIMRNHYNCLKINPKSIESIVDALHYSFNNYSSLVQYATNAFETVRPIVSSKRPSHATHLIQYLEGDINYAKKES